jgi:phosphopantothenoylcysteine decarboxylase / phosphopantothenate---cysteine ligase
MIILGISGSIAAYKSIELAKLLLENGYEFKIVLTKAAADFVSPLTLKSLFPDKIYLHDELLDEKDEMLHISLAKEANMILIAPASANTISKLIYAQADCLLSTICLATEAPIIVAPAMNKVMWENKFVQDNIDKLNYIIGPAVGKQACGDEGFGRMLEPAEIIEHIKYFNIDKSLKNKKILVTAGPTLERIDPVRFLSNDSSGKMGYAIAKMASLMGAEVTLISGPTNLTAHTGIKLIQIESADEMLKETLEQAKHADIFISNAAVADYKPLINHEEKIKKTSNNMTLELTHNPDILSQVKTSFPNIFAVGFAAETNNIKEYGLNKLKQKKLDMIAINDVSNGKTFGQDQNELHVICKDKKDYFIERANKEVVAEKLLELISKSI